MAMVITKAFVDNDGQQFLEKNERLFAELTPTGQRNPFTVLLQIYAILNNEEQEIFLTKIKSAIRSYQYSAPERKCIWTFLTNALEKCRFTGHTRVETIKIFNNFNHLE